MGRGRAKAKQAKVARQLKYSGAGTDLDALRKELLSGSPEAGGGVDIDDSFDDSFADDDEDDTDDYADEADDDTDDTYGATGRR